MLLLCCLKIYKSSFEIIIKTFSMKDSFWSFLDIQISETIPNKSPKVNPIYLAEIRGGYLNESLQPREDRFKLTPAFA